MPDTIWHVTIPAIALVPAATAEDAERIVAKALDRAGFYPYEENRRVFESEPVEASALFHSADVPPHVEQSAEPCDWFLNNSRPNKEWCCNTHMYAGGQAGIEGEDHPDTCEFGDLEGMPDYVIETTQEFTVTYRVTAESPEAAWNELLDAGFVADSVFQSPGNITGTFDNSSIEEDT